MFFASKSPTLGKLALELIRSIILILIPFLLVCSGLSCYAQNIFMKKSDHFSTAKRQTKPNLDPTKLPAKKSLGQNFLTSAVVPRWMCEAASVEKGDVVIEIGPGTGVLTKELLKRGASVVAVETDSRMIAILKEKFRCELTSGKLKIIYGDIRTLTLKNQLPPSPYKVVANIPYYLSGFLLRLMLESDPPPTTLVFLMQKEVVARVARSKKSSLLALAVQIYGTPKYTKTVSRGHFLPIPKVDSAILTITNISHQALPATARKKFFALLHSGFQSKRKQLVSNLQKIIPRVVINDFLIDHNLPSTSRAEDLSIVTWLELYKKVNSYL